jgi:ADP-ribose pyrophosphatase YjhB (NUDIX family)
VGGTDFRLTASAVCIRDNALLLVHWSPWVRKALWTLPGGGLEHAEDPFDTVRREVAEETGYAVAVERLLGVDSVRAEYRGTDWHWVRLVYQAAVVGGALRSEVDGSTDRAAWFPLDEVDSLPRTDLVDIALRLNCGRPPTGHLFNVTKSS